MLPRTLQQLSESNPPNQENDSELKALLRDMGEEDEGIDEPQPGWEQLLLNVYDSGELSHAQINQKRKQLTFAAFRQPHFIDRTLLLEFLISPLVTAMDKLFKRTRHISSLHHSPLVKKDGNQELITRLGSSPLVLHVNRMPPLNSCFYMAHVT